MADYPLINGHRYDFSSVELTVRKSGGAPKRTLGVKEISYSDSLEPGAVRGNRAQKVGRTRGEYNAEGSVSLYKQEWDELLEQLGPGFMETPFDVLITYAELGQPVKTDTLTACRIKKADDSHQEGGEALVVKADLDILHILRDGKSALINPLK